MSELTAALKLNGAYLGLIEKFEKFVDVSDGDFYSEKKILAEAVPDGDALPVSFFIDEKLFSDPPPFTDVYLLGGDAVVYINRYERRSRPLKVIAQAAFCGGTYTLFTNCGKVYLNCEKGECSLYELSNTFEKSVMREEKVGSFPVLTVAGGGCLAVISESGKRVFYNPAESFTCGDKLTVTVNFNTCAGCKATCTFGYDGEKMTLYKSVTEEYIPPDEQILHFAFFESVLTRGNFAKYLCDGLKESAAALPAFLGEFVDVTIPYKKFYERHGDIRAAGLVYPVKSNLFTVKYFATEVENGKITNVYQIED